MLVTGAGGFVGRKLCAELARLGYPVCAALRSPENLHISGCKVVKVSSIDSATDWTGALNGVNTVIHLAARVHVMHDDASDPLEEFRRVNVAGTAHLARSAASSGVKRLVYVSSIKVNGETTCGEAKFTEADAPFPRDPYGVSKWEAEQALQCVAKETGLEVVIVRPPLVYGAEVKGNFSQMLKVLSKGIPLPLAGVDNLRSLIYVENLVDALIFCATHSVAAGQTYLVSDGEDISTSRMLRQLGVAMDHPARLFFCPPVILKLVGFLIGKSDQIERLLGSLRVDSGKIQRELNWCPPYSLSEGLQRTGDSVRRVRQIK
jgi:nucleoside-diphosphate-sugar epimerase